MKTKAAITIALAVALTTTACDGSTTPADPSADESSTPASPTAVASPTPTNHETGTPEPSAPDGSPTSSASATARPGAFEPFTVPLNQSQTDADSGIQVELKDVEVRPDGLVFSLSSFNQTTAPAVLNARPDSIVVYDQDNNRRYAVRAPEDNPTLEYGPSEELTANIAFAAGFSEPPTRLEVLFNYDLDSLDPLDDAVGDGAQVVRVVFGRVDFDPEEF